MAGRRPKPVPLKIVAGNPGKRPLNHEEPQPLRQMPAPPDFLLDEAKAEWRRVAPELHRLGLLTVIDRAVLAAYCQSYGHWLVAERAIGEITAKGATPGKVLTQTASRAQADAVRYASEFGLTPVVVEFGSA